MMKGLRTKKTTPKYSAVELKLFLAFRLLPVVVKSAILLPQIQFILKCTETVNFRLTLFKIYRYLVVWAGIA
jgi:hypothetical protein